MWPTGMNGLIHCFHECLLGLFDSYCFASFSKAFVAGVSITFPVRLLEVDEDTPRDINRGQFGVGGDEDDDDEDDRRPVRWRLTSLLVVRCHWRPSWCRAKLTDHLSVAL